LILLSAGTLVAGLVFVLFTRPLQRWRVRFRKEHPLWAEKMDWNFPWVGTERWIWSVRLCGTILIGAGLWLLWGAYGGR
jgi:hypothetical protein